eukprot:3047911-Amphidinium_carterae.2
MLVVLLLISSSMARAIDSHMSIAQLERMEACQYQVVRERSITCRKKACRIGLTGEHNVDYGGFERMGSIPLKLGIQPDKL